MTSVRNRRLLGGLLLAMALTATMACRPKTQEPSSAPGQPPQPVQQALKGGPYPAIVLSQAWFWKNAEGKSAPGPARLEIWRQTPDGWLATRLEDGQSNVFHKAIVSPDGSILTIGAEKALLKRWRFASGTWTSTTLWERNWGGKFNRLRDIEIGDVDGDGKDEYVIATHDQGVVAVLKPGQPLSATNPVELDRQPDTFVHEIEIGDVDGDGRLEFFATPSERNKVGVSQSGQVVMYKWDGQKYQKTVVDSLTGTHAKKVLVADIDGDGRPDILSAVEAQLDDQKRIVRPVEIRRYSLGKAGAFHHEVLATLPDQQCRFLVVADFDGDGRVEIVAAPMKTGLYLLKSTTDPKTRETKWAARQFETNSSGFEHAAFAADLDGDGRPELYVAADDQHELDRYVFDPKTNAVTKTRIGPLDSSVITWNIGAGRL
jgi:hypothetical protein